MATWQLERKPTEAILLAVLSIVAVAALRFPVEMQTLFIAEMFAIAGLVATKFIKTFKYSYISLAAPVTPIVFAIIARTIGRPIAFEMTVLTTFGAAALVMALGCNRTRAMSLVASGFLTLFAVTISDNTSAVLLAITWMAVCIWHLVANHWEQVELCSADQVRRGSSVRPVSVFVAIAVCIVSGWVVQDRFGESKRFEFGFMPTSGGSLWSDPAARGGVGTGDAAIAARDHAESFGAVESDLFLESTESTLFDMFSDSIGEPQKKTKWERRQGLTADRVLEAHQKTAKSEKGGSSFSTDRMPPKKHLHLNDSAENAVVQWAGPTGIRLAMNRYDTFNGVQWTNEAEHRNEKLIRQELDGAVWYCDPAARPLAKLSTQVNLLKVLRLDSTRLPVPMMTSAVHIKDVDRPDFFAIEDDGSFFMPGRDKVPQLTVVNIASVNIMEDELWKKLTRDTLSERMKQDRPELLTSSAMQWTADLDHPYEKLQAIVSHLRTEFTFDREVALGDENSLAAFMRTRRGGDHLFATTAALMAREIGLQSRLVTGFYVRPSAIDVAAGHTNILPADVHVWTEIRLNDGRWFEIEPTPGYREPIYTPSTWLVAKQFAAANWPQAIGMTVIAGLLFLTRLFWIELGLTLFYPIGSLVWPRGRLTLAMHVLQTRAKVAGCPRQAGRPQRDWLLALTATQESLRETAGRFCDAADRAAFAGNHDVPHDHNLSKELLMNLKIRILRQLATETSR
ncbi:transglutaminase-like domain-containing protein [Stieleria sp. TO1_6]|uniref:transglutaminase-like domain-containing protein n=1 Tax=Stieleria tagensis TaxID=2956795 RepID=UPI00209B30EE|nr:transglutaminase-like domain-containing protein [Stieleria tagensis]MCO8123091.1 transglutaminase-like domain-containing protein [Stieleria tagensis]